MQTTIAILKTRATIKVTTYNDVKGGIYMHICPKCHSKMYDGDFCMNCGYRPKKHKKNQQDFDHIETKTIKNKAAQLKEVRMQNSASKGFGATKSKIDDRFLKSEAKAQKHFVFYFIMAVLVLFWVLRIVNLFLSKF